MLIIFALFIEQSKVAGQLPADVSTWKSMAAFSFLLFLVYGLFGSLLATFRDDIIKTDNVTGGYTGDAGYGNQQGNQMVGQGDRFDDIPPDEDNQI